nr:HAD hydrolase-like protein [Deltaproteobacteria bacterium]
LSSCYLVGDKVSDLEAARAAGVKAVLVLTGFGVQTRTLLERGAIGGISAPVMPDLLTAVQWIVRDRETHEDPHR